MHPLVPDWPSLVTAHLGRGKDRATKIGDLAQDMGIHRSIVEHAIEAARKEGVAICSGQEGVWIGETEAEIKGTADALAHRLVSQYLTVRALRQTARRYAKERQLAIWSTDAA